MQEDFGPVLVLPPHAVLKENPAVDIADVDHAN